MNNLVWFEFILTILIAIYLFFHVKRVVSLKQIYGDWIFFFGILVCGGLFNCIIEKMTHWEWYWGISLVISILASIVFAFGFFLRKHLLMVYSFIGFVIYWAFISYRNIRYLYIILKMDHGDILSRFIYPNLLWIIVSLSLIIESVYIGNRILKLAKSGDINPEYQESRLCPSCKKTISGDARFCNHCGTMIADG